MGGVKACMSPACFLQEAGNADVQVALGVLRSLARQYSAAGDAFRCARACVAFSGTQAAAQVTCLSWDGRALSCRWGCPQGMGGDWPLCMACPVGTPLREGAVADSMRSAAWCASPSPDPSRLTLAQQSQQKMQAFVSGLLCGAGLRWRSGRGTTRCGTSWAPPWRTAPAARKPSLPTRRPWT